ncbi:MAG: insulinase family protein [Tissierellia bacterium]|nr:insulinase family protein [Bacillota bacterium]NLL23332.1 insulinase family protein [Tissierellia bacterium]
MNKYGLAVASLIEKVQPDSRHYLHDKRRKDWGLSLFFVQPFSSFEVTYASMLGRVLESSSSQYPSLQLISRREEELYGSHVYSRVESFADQMVLSFHLRALRDEFVREDLSEKVIDHLEQILYSPNFSGDGFESESFEVERERLLDAMSSFGKDPMNLAYAGALRGCLKGDLGLLPMENTRILKEMTPCSLKAYYEKLIEKSKRHLLAKGPFEASSQGRVRPLSAFEPDLLAGSEWIEEGNHAQSVMVQMYTTSLKSSDPMAMAMYMFTRLWGGGSFSHLFQRVREDQGLCYAVSADYSRSLGLVSVSAGFLNDDRKRLNEAIEGSLEALKKEGVSEDVFSGMKAELCTEMISRSEGIGSDLSAVFFRSLLGENLGLEERLKRVEEVTMDEVLHAADKVAFHSSFTLLGGWR